MPDTQAAETPSLRKDFFKVLLVPVLWLYVVPVGALLFTRYGEQKLDREFLAAAEHQITVSQKIDPDQKSR